MPNNLLDKITWNFIHERQTVDGSDYVKSIITKLEVILSKNVSHSVRSNLKTALEDLRKVNLNVIRLKGRVEELESENQELKTKLERLKAKSKSTKEE
jgi:predicted RNase H-like nuclease (RuvC/YqgF family)